MSSTTTNRITTSSVQDRHEPLSNQLDDDGADLLGEDAFEAGSEGSAAGASQGFEGETETLPGIRRVTDETDTVAWTVPDTSRLRDIAEASFGELPVGIETVHGPDDRVQITNTAVYPWRVHASLLITAADNSQWIGTGWFIGPHTLITAGHVVFIKNSPVAERNGWVRSITVMPGRNGGALPYGAVTSRNFRTVKGWANDADVRTDYGAIIIPTELGSTVGWFGFGVYSDAALSSTTANIAGYPGDKPSGTLWYAYRQLDSVDSYRVYYDIDTFGGQSGSSVYRIDNGQRRGVAVHTSGGASTNSGTRVNSAVFNNFVAWKA